MRYGGYRELVIVDDGSTDDSVARVRQEFPGVRVIRNVKNLGFAESVNRGVLESQGLYVAILNDDVEVTKGWLAPLIDEMERDLSVAACQPKLLSETRPSHFEYAGAAGGYLDAFGYPFCRGRIFWTVEEDTGQYDDPVDIFWASGSAFAVRRSLFVQAHLFDSDFFAHMEEIDICWRLQRMGYRIRSVPSSVVYHQGGGTLPYGDPKKNYLNHRNNLAMLAKNVSFPKLIFLLGVRVVMEGTEVLYWALRCDGRRALGIVRAWGWNLLHFGKTLEKKRWINSGNQNVKARYLPIYPGSILFAFFFRRVVKFSQLRWTPK